MSSLEGFFIFLYDVSIDFVFFDHFKPNPWRLKQQIISQQIVDQCGSTRHYSVKNQGENQQQVAGT